jgi:hypothetical protein
MKEKDRTHWMMHEIAEQEADGPSIDLWPRLETRIASLDHPTRVTIRRKKIERFAFGLALILLLIGSLFIVPEVRAFTEGVFQRMGIAFVNTDQIGDHVTVQQVEITPVAPPPSLSMEEIRQQISFNLMVPAWLPDGLVYVYRSIREYDPADTAGSGQKVSIEYGRSDNPDPESGLLRLTANDGPISAPPLLAASREQSVMVNSLPGIYVHGGWQDDGRGDPNTKMGSLLWDDHADDAYLTWTQAGVTYLLEAHNLGLGLEDLLRIAGSMSGQ